MNMRIAYLVNTYPGPYITYIRREIRAMEALGVSTFRYALRSGRRSSADPEDETEERITKYILQSSALELLKCSVKTMLLQPAAARRAIRDALRIGLRSDRGILRHLMYLVEEMVLASWCRRDNIQHVHAH